MSNAHASLVNLPLEGGGRREATGGGDPAAPHSQALDKGAIAQHPHLTSPLKGEE